MFSVLNANLAILCAIIFLILLYFYLTKKFYYWKNRNVPYLTPVPFLGNITSLLAQKENLGEFLARAHHSTTFPYLGLFILDKPYLLIRDGDVLKKILIKNFENFVNRITTDNKSDKIAGNMLFMSESTEWQSSRKKITPAFSSGKLKKMLPLIVEISESFVRQIETASSNEESTDSRAITLKYGIDVIAACIFGLNARELESEAEEFGQMCKRFLCLSFSRGIQMALYFFAPLVTKIFRMKFLDPVAAQYMKTIFMTTIAEREKSGVTRGDFIDLLTEMKLDENGVTGMGIQMLLAGFETTATTVSFVLYELSKDQLVQARLRAEVHTVLQKHQAITYKAIQEMKYLNAVVKETLRKYPILPFLDRRCSATFKLPESDLVIEKGVGIYVSLLGLHYDPKNFPNPEKFDPERFLGENIKTIAPFTYMPFGGGMRNCIGSRFANLSSKVGVIQVMRKFQLDRSEEAAERINFSKNSVFLAPANGTLHVRFKRLA